MSDDPPIPLLPCPFCGGSPVALTDTWLQFMGCHVCDLTGPKRNTLSEAKDAWNRRALPARVIPSLIDVIRRHASRAASPAADDTQRYISVSDVAILLHEFNKQHSSPDPSHNRFTEEGLDFLEHHARRDDWHLHFVSSDIRLLISEIRRLQRLHTTPDRNGFLDAIRKYESSFHDSYITKQEVVRLFHRHFGERP